MTNPETWAPMKGARIDFAAMLTDIAYLLGEPMPGGHEHVRVPVSQEKLAEHLQVPRGTLRGWLDGSEPRHADGELILSYWCRLSGKARTFAPVDRFVYSAAKVERKPSDTVDKSVLRKQAMTEAQREIHRLAGKANGPKAAAATGTVLRRLSAIASSNGHAKLDPSNDPVSTDLPD